MIGSAGGQPVRAVFPVNTLRAVLVKTQTGTAPTFDPPFSIALSILDAVPGAVGQLVYGKFTSPDYEIADKRIIPPTPTRTGRPKVQGSNRLVFEIFVPAGVRPPGGWPVVIWEHGLRRKHLSRRSLARRVDARVAGHRDDPVQRLWVMPAGRSARSLYSAATAPTWCSTPAAVASTRTATV